MPVLRRVRGLGVVAAVAAGVTSCRAGVWAHCLGIALPLLATAVLTLASKAALESLSEVQVTCSASPVIH